MPSFSSAKSINAAFSPAYRPTALFVGGTSGIGEGTATAFAQATKGNAHILIAGRNQAAAERIIATFPKTEVSKYEFVPCDASLIKNVVAVAADVRSRISGTLNYLVMSQGILNNNGQEPTSEGIEITMSLNFYSRWKFVDELLPNLEKAVEEGQEARVLTILSAGKGGPLDLDDLGLKKHLSLTRRLSQATTYNDIFVKEYSNRYPGISFMHIYPGWVATPIYDNYHWTMKFIAPIMKLPMTSPRDCGEWMTAALVTPDYKSGGFHLNEHADPIPEHKIFAQDKASNAILLEHYVKEVAVA